MTVTTLVEVLERAVDGDLADSLGILEVMTMCLHCGFSEPACAAGRRRGSRGCCPDCDHPHPWEAEEAGGVS